MRIAATPVSSRCEEREQSLINSRGVLASGPSYGSQLKERVVATNLLRQNMRQSTPVGRQVCNDIETVSLFLPRLVV